MAALHGDLEGGFTTGDPEAVLDLLAIQSLRMRHREDDVSKAYVPVFPSDNDMAAFVRDLAIDDTIARTFADIPPSSDPPTLIPENVRSEDQSRWQAFKSGPIVKENILFIFKPEKNLMGSASTTSSSSALQAPSVTQAFSQSHHKHSSPSQSSPGHEDAIAKPRGFLGALSRAVKSLKGECRKKGGQDQSSDVQDVQVYPSFGEQIDITRMSDDEPTLSTSSELQKTLSKDAVQMMTLSDGASAKLTADSAHLSDGTEVNTKAKLSVSMEMEKDTSALQEKYAISKQPGNTTRFVPTSHSGLGVNQGANSTGTPLEHCVTTGRYFYSVDQSFAAGKHNKHQSRHIVQQGHTQMNFQQLPFLQTYSEHILRESQTGYFPDQLLSDHTYSQLKQKGSFMNKDTLDPRVPEKFKTVPISEQNYMKQMQEAQMQTKFNAKHVPGEPRVRDKHSGKPSVWQFSQGSADKTQVNPDTIDDVFHAEFAVVAVDDTDDVSTVKGSKWGVWMEGVETFIDFENDPEQEIGFEYKWSETNCTHDVTERPSLAAAYNMMSQTEDESVTSGEQKGRNRAWEHQTDQSLTPSIHHKERDPMMSRTGQPMTSTPIVEAQKSRAVHSLERAVEQLSTLTSCSSCSKAATRIMTDLEMSLSEVNAIFRGHQKNLALGTTDKHYYDVTRKSQAMLQATEPIINEKNDSKLMIADKPLPAVEKLASEVLCDVATLATHINFKVTVETEEELCLASNKLAAETAKPKGSTSNNTKKVNVTLKAKAMSESDSDSTSTVTSQPPTGRIRKKRTISMANQTNDNERVSHADSAIEKTGDCSQVSANVNTCTVGEGEEASVPISNIEPNVIAEAEKSSKCYGNNKSVDNSDPRSRHATVVGNTVAYVESVSGGTENANVDENSAETSEASLCASKENLRQRTSAPVYKYAGAAEVDTESLMTSTWSEMTSVSSVIDVGTSADESSYYSGDDDADEDDEDEEEDEEEEDEDEDDEDEEEDDDDPPLVRLCLAHEDRDESRLRHERLQRHLSSVLHQSSSRSAMVETVVAATGERLSILERPQYTGHVNKGLMYPFPTNILPTVAPPLQSSSPEDGVTAAEWERGGSNKEGLFSSKMPLLRRSSRDREGRTAGTSKRGGTTRLFSPDRQVALVAARQMTSDEFRESYDRSSDAAKAKRSQLDSDIPWDLLQFSDTDEDTVNEKAWYNVTSEEDNVTHAYSTDTDSSAVTSDW